MPAMSERQPRPCALVAIVTYKCFTAGLLLVVAIALFLTSKKHEELLTFADEYMTIGKREIIKTGLHQLLSISTTKIKFGAFVAAIYAVVNAIEALGLWHQKAWATILVVAIVGATIPLEVYEIVQRISLVKLAVFAINVAMFVYLLGHTIEQRNKRGSRG
jgi:uncharacterized membrane protein (DUF2068 family)